MHPLEGSGQETILPFTPLLTPFSVALYLAHPPPDGRRRIPVCSRVVSAVGAPHPPPIRIKASCRLTCSPHVCPWHLVCPRTPSVPAWPQEASPRGLPWCTRACPRH